MFATRHLNLAQGEVIKWLAILTLACLLAALAGRLVSGDETAGPDRQPGLLPATIEQLARPMNVTPPTTTVDPRPDAATQLWQILSRQKDGEYEQVLEEWQDAPLSCETEVWRHVARGQAASALRRMTKASEALEAALDMEPENAVARYFRGLLRLELAATAGQWYDAIGPTPYRFVSTHMPGEPSLTKSMYRLAARMDLERAIEEAATVSLDQPLCAARTPAAAALEPTVRDLLIALSAEDFEGKAHHVLSYLLLEDGAAGEAEQHLDQAAALGQCILYGYRDLGALYERQHEHLDAVRAYTKSLSHGTELAGPLTKILRNLRQAIVEEF